jgi:soluble lytic murein transglycosylase
MTLCARKSAVLFVLFPIFMGIAFTNLISRSAYAKIEIERNDAIEKSVTYLKNKNGNISEGILKNVVHAVYKESRRCDIDYRLTLAVIKAESNFRQDAVSKKGARGLMQITPSLAKYIAKDAGVKYSGDQCLHQPEKNIRIGVFHLARLMNNFKNLPTALHAYNAGETRARTRKAATKEPKTAYTKHVIEEYKKSLIVLPEASKLYKEVNLLYKQSRVSDDVAIAHAGKTLLQPEWPGNVSKMCWAMDISQSRLCSYNRVYLKRDLQCLIDRYRRSKSFHRSEKVLVYSSTISDIWWEEDLKMRHKHIVRI